MAAGDARPIPIRGSAYRVTFPILDADGDLVSGAAGLDSEVSVDGGSFSDCTNEATEIATSSGMYFLDLTPTEMTGDTIAVIVKTSTTGAKTTPLVIYPATATGEEIPVDLQKWLGTAPLALTSQLVQAQANQLGTQGKTDVNAEVDVALNTAVPVSPTADSINERIKRLEEDVTPTRAANLDNLDQAITAVEADTSDIQGRLPAALILGRIDASIGAISGDAIAADNLEADYDGTGYSKSNSTIGTCVTNQDMRGTDNAALATDTAKVVRKNTAQAGTGSSITLDAGASAQDDLYNGCTIVLTGGTGVGQANYITDYVGSTKVATVSRTFVISPSSDTTFELIGSIGSDLFDTAADRVEIQGTKNRLDDLNDISTANVNAEVDAALDTAIPASPTANSINERVAAIDNKLPTGNISDFNEASDNVTVGTNNDKTGYSISGTITTLDGLNNTAPAIKKNTALAAYPFVMVDTNGDPKTAETVTGERSIDGAAFGSLANSVTEVGNGVYKVDLADTDLNGDTITLRFTSAAAKDRLITIVTQ